MKKWIATLLALVLMLAATLPAFAEQTVFTLEGFVTEVVEGGFVMEDKTLGTVMLNTDGQTVWDGALIDGALEVGQYVFVDYDGKLTRSIPPQAHADRVGCYVLSGVVGEITDDGVLLTGDEVFGDVLVRLQDVSDPVFAGVPMTVYYNGVMAMSLPGQVGASAVIVPVLEGAVSEPDEQGFTLTTDEGESYRVELDESSLIGELVENADEESAEIADVENEEIVDGAVSDADAEVDATDTDASILTDETPEATEAPTITLADVMEGDRVRVYFSGEYLSDEEDAVLALEALILRQ